MQFFVTPQCLLEEHDFLLAFHTSSSGVGPALFISFHLVQLDHLLDTLQILLLDIKLELDLGEHELDAGPEVRRVKFDKI